MTHTTEYPYIYLVHLGKLLFFHYKRIDGEVCCFMSEGLSDWKWVMSGSGLSVLCAGTLLSLSHHEGTGILSVLLVCGKT